MPHRLEAIVRSASAPAALLAALVAFAPALFGGFVYDDHPAILKNPRVTGGPIAEIFTTGSYWREEEVGYRPLATLSFRAERALFGERPFAFHATNLALHAANAALVVLLADRVLVAAGGGGAIAVAPLLAGLLFAVHPVQSEAVCGIAAGRSELLAAFFALASLVALPGRAGSFAGAILFLAALLSKESAIVLPALAFALERKDRRVGSLRRYGGLAVALVAYLLLRHAALGRFGGFAPAFLDNPLAHATRAAFLPGVLRVLSEYARLLVWPAALSADYGFNAVPLPKSIGSASLLPGLALAATVAGVALTTRRRGGHSMTVRLALAFAATLIVPLHLVTPLPALCAERFLYLPVALLAMFVAAAALGPGADERRMKKILAVAAVIVIALGARSAARAREWRTEFALFSSSVRAQPGSARLHNALGLAHRQAGRAAEAEAEAEYRRAIAIAPDYGPPLVNLGNLLFERGAADSARAVYETALAQDPGYGRARWNLAVALERLGNPAAAAREYATLAANDPRHFDARLRLGELLAAAGRRDEARRALEEALAIRPNDTAALRALERIDGAPTTNAADAPDQPMR